MALPSGGPRERAVRAGQQEEREEDILGDTRTGSRRGSRTGAAEQRQERGAAGPQQAAQGDDPPLEAGKGSHTEIGEGTSSSTGGKSKPGVGARKAAGAGAEAPVPGPSLAAFPETVAGVATPDTVAVLPRGVGAVLSYEVGAGFAPRTQQFHLGRQPQRSP